MLMGAAEANALKEPTKKTVFVEDLTPEEKAKLFKEHTGVRYHNLSNNMNFICFNRKCYPVDWSTWETHAT